MIRLSKWPQIVWEVHWKIKKSLGDLVYNKTGERLVMNIESETLMNATRTKILSIKADRWYEKI